LRAKIAEALHVVPERRAGPLIEAIVIDNSLDGCDGVIQLMTVEPAPVPFSLKLAEFFAGFVEPLGFAARIYGGSGVTQV
jgi:hypothetical protein